VQTSKTRSRGRSLPGGLESPRAKLVYLALDRDGPATVDELHDRLGETRLALFAILDGLADRGLVTDAGHGYDVATP